MNPSTIDRSMQNQIFVGNEYKVVVVSSATYSITHLLNKKEKVNREPELCWVRLAYGCRYKIGMGMIYRYKVTSNM